MNTLNYWVLALGLIGFAMVVVGFLWRCFCRRHVSRHDHEQILHRKIEDAQALRESEERYRTLVENAPEAIMVLDVDKNRFVDMNESAIRLFKLSRDKLLKTDPFELSPPIQPSGRQSTEVREEILAKVFRGEVQVFEWLHLDGKGNNILCEIRLMQIPAFKRRLIRATINDISARKRKEEALRFSQFATDHNSDAIFWVEVDGRISYVNEAACRSLGYSRDELLTMKVPDFDPDFPEERWPEHFQELKEVGSLTFESHHRAKDGRVFPVEIMSNYLRYDEREFLCAYARDITERKLAEKEIHESEERWRSLVQNAPDFVFMLERDGTIQFINRTLHHLPDRDETVGMSIYSFIPPEYHEKTRKSLELVFETGGTCRFETEGPGINGTTAWYECRFAPIKRRGLSNEGKVASAIMIASDMSERQRMEAEKARTLSLLRATLESTADGILVVDSVGKWSSFNQRFVDMWYIPEEIVESGDDDKALAFVLDQLVNPEGFLKKVRQLYEKPDAESYDVIEFKDGRVFERFSKPQRLVEQNVGRVWSFRDVTERRRADKALHESEQSFRLAFENAKDAMFWADVETGMILKCNRAAELLLEKNKEGIVGQHQSSLHPPEKEAGYSEMFNRHVAERGTVDDEAEVITASGKIKPVHITAAATVLGEKRIMQGIFRDITERKRAEEEIEKHNKFLNNVLESLTHPFYVVNVNDYRIELANTSSGIDILRKDATCYSVTHHKDEPCSGVHVCPMEEVVRTGKPAVVEHTHHNSSGTHIVEIHGYPIFDDTGKVTQMIEYVFDITDKKHAQEELRKKTEELERSNKELEQFAYIASHDLQEPLRKIITFGDRLISASRTALDEKGLDYIDRMQKSSLRMRQVVEDLLEYSRVTTRAKPFESVNLTDVIKEAIADLELSISQSEAKLEVGDLPEIKADRRQMRELFVNLISNALKFCRKNVPPRVSIRSRTIDDQRVEITVEDRGIGFDEKYTEQIFQPFQRLHPRSEYDGTGVGLASCLKIVQRHGGEITAKSEVGKGSIFVITLPTRRTTTRS